MLNGVRQGGVLSPLLFVVAVDLVARVLHAEAQAMDAETEGRDPADAVRRRDQDAAQRSLARLNARRAAQNLPPRTAADVATQSHAAFSAELSPAEQAHVRAGCAAADGARPVVVVGPAAGSVLAGAQPPPDAVQPWRAVLAALLYADDVVVFAKTRTGLLRLLRALNVAVQHVGLSVNAAKSSVCVFTAGVEGPTAQMLEALDVAPGLSLRAAASLRYLGVAVDQALTFDSHRADLLDRMRPGTARLLTATRSGRLPTWRARAWLLALVRSQTGYATGVWASKPHIGEADKRRSRAARQADASTRQQDASTKALARAWLNAVKATVGLHPKTTGIAHNSLLADLDLLPLPVYTLEALLLSAASTLHASPGAPVALLARAALTPHAPPVAWAGAVRHAASLVHVDLRTLEPPPFVRGDARAASLAAAKLAVRAAVRGWWGAHVAASLQAQRSLGALLRPAQAVAAEVGQPASYARYGVPGRASSGWLALRAAALSSHPPKETSARVDKTRCPLCGAAVDPASGVRETHVLDTCMPRAPRARPHSSSSGARLHRRWGVIAARLRSAGAALQDLSAAPTRRELLGDLRGLGLRPARRDHSMALVQSCRALESGRRAVTESGRRAVFHRPRADRRAAARSCGALHCSGGVRLAWQA
jgi:hypothetical protein